jgi:hypothetical protein
MTLICAAVGGVVGVNSKGKRYWFLSKFVIKYNK